MNDHNILLSSVADSSTAADSERPVRIVVELVSSADVRRLEDRDDEIRAELNQLRRENEGLRRSFYELLEVFGDFKCTRTTLKK